jgi:hypothetical protein
MAATNTWDFGNGALVMGDRLEDCQFPITDYLFSDVSSF